MDNFSIDVEAIRKDARKEIEKGAITTENKTDTRLVCKILNDALATEMICVLRYKEHFYAAVGMHSVGIAEEFLEHARQEQEHADKLSKRISQLGGDPILDPSTFAEKSHTVYVTGDTLTQMIEENLIAERIVIETYNQIIRYLGERDPTTRRLLEQILEEEEEHADELRDMLIRLAEKF